MLPVPPILPQCGHSHVALGLPFNATLIFSRFSILLAGLFAPLCHGLGTPRTESAIFIEFINIDQLVRRNISAFFKYFDNSPILANIVDIGG
jgi:hypothetical protein